MIICGAKYLTMSHFYFYFFMIFLKHFVESALFFRSIYIIDFSTFFTNIKQPYPQEDENNFPIFYYNILIFTQIKKKSNVK